MSERLRLAGRRCLWHSWPDLIHSQSSSVASWRLGGLSRSDAMHEVSLMQDTLILAVRHAREQGAQRIHRLTMRIGDLSGVVPDALEFAFDVVARGTMAEGASLEIRRVPIRCYCAGCEREFEAADMCCECPHCHRPTADIRGGREMELTSLEVS